MSSVSFLASRSRKSRGNQEFGGEGVRLDFLDVIGFRRFT
jgi:hypothetical protein